MRLAHASAAAVTLALLIPTLAAQTPQDADKKVSGGGISAPGWKGKIDSGATKKGMAITDSKFGAEGNALRLTSGPAAIYWNEKNMASGDYTVKATFKEPKQTYNHPHPFGVFIGGSKLDTEDQNLMYCVAYRDGTFVIRHFAGPTVTTLVRKTPHAAIAKAAGPEEAVTQEVGWTVKGGRAECVINGQVVHGFDRAEIVGPGKLESTDGVAGLRTSHNSDVTISGFGISK